VHTRLSLTHIFKEADKQRLRACETLDDVKTLVGEDTFNHAIQRFDALNEQVIELYEHKARSLETFLEADEKGLITI
jgi:hypothetical protein